MTHAARFPRSGRRSLQAVPPVLPEWLIPRPRLDRLLDDGTVRRLTTVVADPGFGKSTVLAGWAANTRCAWYTLGSADRGLSTLTAGLLDALRLHVPGLPADLDPAADGRGPDADTEELRRAEALAASLAIALDERLRRDLVLVLDDVQELMSGEASARLVEGLVRGAPPRLHVVLASRVDVTFPIERLRAQGQVSSIAGADLAFNVDEVSGVLAAALGPHDAELAADLHGRTGGWPAAVRLAADAMRGVSAGERRAILGRALRSGGAVYDYLATRARLDEALGRVPMVDEGAAS